MKNKSLVFFIFSLLIACGVGTHAQTDLMPSDGPLPEDSTLYVVAGYFEKGDTLIYSIDQGKWCITPEDTTMLAAISKMVRLVVSDSTTTGYKMDYTFLGINSDTTLNANQSSSLSSVMTGLKNKFIDKLQKSLTGTTIKFETDSFGRITEFTNLGDIKKQIKDSAGIILEEVFALPQAKVLKDVGVTQEIIMKSMNIDNAVDNYLSEIRELFKYHGMMMPLGHRQEHEDATEGSYESDTESFVWIDEKTNRYVIASEITNYLPVSQTLAPLMSLVEKETGKEILVKPDEATDKKNKNNSTLRFFFSTEYLPSGYPLAIISEEEGTFGNVRTMNQKYINLEYVSSAKQ